MFSSPKNNHDYKPIADYAAIGNLRTSALVGLDGSIDWCCFPELASPSVFAAILDHRKGGRFRVVPRHIHRREQRYIPETNVLETVFDADGGRLTITDLMPLRGDIIGRGKSEAPREIHRILHAEGGQGVEVEVEWSPRFDYARSESRITKTQGGAIAQGEHGERMVLAGLPADAETEVEGHQDGRTFRARFVVEGGRRVALVNRWDSDVLHAHIDDSMEALEQTVEVWRRWVHKDEVAERDWAGPWADHIVRSELALKLLTHGDTGAIAAAATTSLPEHIGGVRNWDYRYSWIRDAALLVQALIGVGHSEEARDFLHWAEEVSEAHLDEEQGMQVLYGLHGENDVPEMELEHLDGYRGSRPVRIGNGAFGQRQLDVYSELLCSAYEITRREKLPPKFWAFLEQLADRACEHWQKPDSSIWEMRTGPHHYVYSKVHIWSALDRAIHLAEQHELEGDVERWRHCRDQVRDEVLEKGVDPQTGAFVQRYGSRDPDAANLQITIEEFLPPDDPRVQATIDQTLQHLTENGLVYRYRTDDGLPGEEGAFVLCTFWLVDALALSGRLDEAHAIFEGVAKRVNHVGLYSEQIDPKTGEFLGNFPQAFSHIGLITSALYLAHAEGRHTPEIPLIGTKEHREQIRHTR